jgi:hypothetical protein
MLEAIQIINVLLGGGLMVLGWFARELWSAVKNLKEDLIKLKTELSDNYVRKDDFKDFKRDLFDILRRIEDKLDTKQDK